MNNTFQEKRGILLALVGLFLVLLVVIYFAFLRPLTGELESKESSLGTLKSDIHSLEKEVLALDQVVESFDMERVVQEKKIPVNRQLEELILLIQEIELVSLSEVETIDFTYDSSLPDTVFLQEGEEEDPDGTDTDADTEEVADEEGAKPAIDLSEKPETLEVITIRMEVSSPSYERFQTFITEIEKQERIMLISRLDFDKPAEEELVIADHPDETMTFNLELVTFYYGE